MGRYTTGELAKQCGVSVRTVQYYDTRGILSPSELSDGGRRLYSEADLNKMRIICFLRSLELPIDGIKSLLDEEGSEKVISMLLDEQENLLRAEIDEKTRRVMKIIEAKRALQYISNASVDSLADVVHIVENRKKLRRLRALLIMIGSIMDAIQLVTLAFWIAKGVWIPFVIGLVPVIGLGVLISWIYFKGTAYICPECHTVFKPKLIDSLFARHTPNTRRLRCTACGHHGFCIETYGKEDKNA